MGDTRRLGSIATADSQGTLASAQILGRRYDVVQHILLEDTYHEFIIGKNPMGEGSRKTVTFQMLDGTIISTAEYAEGETIAIPEVEGLLGWADSTTGELVEIDTTMGQNPLTYTAVLATDKFNVTVNLNSGEYTTAPEGTTVENGKLNSSGQNL